MCYESNFVSENIYNNLTHNQDNDIITNVHNTRTCSISELSSDVRLSENINTDSNVIISNNKCVRDNNSNQSQHSISINNSFDYCNVLNLGLKRKGMNIGHINVQGMNSKEKFSELS